MEANKEAICEKVKMETTKEEEKAEEKKTEDKKTITCTFVFTFGQRKGSLCGRPCMKGGDVCKMHTQDAIDKHKKSNRMSKAGRKSKVPRMIAGYREEVKLFTNYRNENIIANVTKLLDSIVATLGTSVKELKRKKDGELEKGRGRFHLI